MTDLTDVLRIYQGSDGKATSGLYAALEQIGPAGHIAVNLFRACKTSERAKVYRGRNSRGAAYDTKQWAMGNLCDWLTTDADDLGIRWGWAADARTPGFENVLYVEIATGQVSFHTAVRGVGPDFAGKWDGVRRQAPDRICRWVAQLLGAPAELAPITPAYETAGDGEGKSAPEAVQLSMFG